MDERATGIERVCVVGAGTMGSQIALSSALHGYRVSLYDVSPEVLEQANRWSREYLERQVARGRVSREAVDRAQANLELATDLPTAARDADLVIEAVPEDLDLKLRTFAELGRICKPSAILATNSSSIASSRLADAVPRPERVANLHYFNPALVMEAVEVVQGPHTSDGTAQALVDFVNRIGKMPIHLKKEIFGFVANRLLDALLEEAIFLVENGYASPDQIDGAAEKALGHPMGPFRLMDLIGIDVIYRMRQEKFMETGQEADKPPRSIAELYEQGHWGRKTGRGWYEYGG